MYRYCWKKNSICNISDKKCFWFSEQLQIALFRGIGTTEGDKEILETGNSIIDTIPITAMVILIIVFSVLSQLFPTKVLCKVKKEMTMLLLLLLLLWLLSHKDAIGQVDAIEVTELLFGFPLVFRD